MKSTSKSVHPHRNHEIMAEADGLLSRLSHSSLGEEAKALAEKLRETVDILKEDARKQIKSGVASTEGAIKRHPWISVGAAAGTGYVIARMARWMRKAA